MNRYARLMALLSSVVAYIMGGVLVGWGMGRLLVIKLGWPLWVPAIGAVIGITGGFYLVLLALRRAEKVLNE